MVYDMVLATIFYGTIIISRVLRRGQVNCGDVEPSASLYVTCVTPQSFNSSGLLSNINMVTLCWKSIATAVTVGFQLDIVNCFFVRY